MNSGRFGMSADFVVDRIGSVLSIELYDDLILLLGRNPDNDIVFGAPTVSRVHACLYVYGGQVWIRDLSSANGVYLNQSRIVGDTAVHPRDEISLGPDTRIQVRMARQAMSA